MATTATPPARCPHFPRCAGCAWIGVRYGEQLRRKRECVAAALGGFADLRGVAVPEVRKSPRSFGYRNQAKLVVRRGRRGAMVGIYRPGTHQVVDISACPVHAPLINRILEKARDEIQRHRVPLYDERSRSGWLRYLIVRVSGWQRAAQVVFVVRDRRPALERALGRGLRRMREVASVVLNVNATTGNAILGRNFVPMAGKPVLIERVGGLKLQIHAGAFVQANMAAAKRVYECVLEWAAPLAHETVVDLYCGVGAISFTLAPRSRLVCGIEESRIAVADAKANVRLNGFHNARFFAGDVGATLPAVMDRVECVDLVTLNPPRNGADERARRAIADCAPSRIVYVSCEPASLARDLAWFAGHGYRTERVQPFDLFPQTEHVECVALMTRKDAGASARR